MKKVTCQCGRTIEVVSGVAGLRRRFPKEIYLCECGYAYIPQELACMGVGFESSVGPRALTPSEYAQFKEEEVRCASKYNIPFEEAIVEIHAKVVSK